jgi:hypothetical protein
MRISIKIVGRDQNGPRYAEVNRSGDYFTFTLSGSERETRMLAIKRRAIEAHREFERYHQALEDMGAVDRGDPYGYLA